MDAATTAVITRDPELLRWVQGCAVGSGGQVVAIAEDDGAPGSWHSHALVLLGADMVAAVRRAGPVRHRCVHLIAGSGATAEVLRAAMEFGVLSVLDPRRDAHRVATLLAAVADPRPPGRLIALTSGSGGAGASTLAAAVALVAAPESTVALVVTDPRAPDPCLLLGADPAPGLRWEDLELSRGRVGPKALREALPRHRGVLVLGFGPGASSASGDTFTGGLESARSAFDLVVVDVAGAESDTRWPEVVTRADRV